MTTSSFYLLTEQNPRYQTPQHLLDQDEHAGVDIGWVEQMLPLIQEFSHTGHRVLDPFAGLGTTLIASRILEREAIGIEISAQRCQLLQQRWQAFGTSLHLDENDVMEIYQGDALQQLQTMDMCPIHLALSNMPYFSVHATQQHTAHLYQQHDYHAYLNYITQVFRVLRPRLFGGAHVILTVENIRQNNGELLPLAWDIAQRLAKVFNVFDERILIYPHTQRLTTHPLHHARQHEYILIAKKYLQQQHVEWLASLIPYLQQHFAVQVFGSFHQYLQQQAWQHIGDLDLLIQPDPTRIQQLLNYLNQFCPIKLYSWNRQISIDEIHTNWSEILSKHYVRLMLEKDQDTLQIDLMFNAQ